jgi:hypothetical protein
VGVLNLPTTDSGLPGQLDRFTFELWAVLFSLGHEHSVLAYYDAIRCVRTNGVEPLSVTRQQEQEQTLLTVEWELK